MSEVQNMSMWDARPMHDQCMTNAWISTHGEKCIKHNTNDQNMINMNNYGDPQSLVLIRIQNMVIPKVWYSLESKTTTKCHLGILLNT